MLEREWIVLSSPGGGKSDVILFSWVFAAYISLKKTPKHKTYAMYNKILTSKCFIEGGNIVHISSLDMSTELT